ncbi:MAG: hypothetical protein F4X83_01780 [Chloroflexi bacterium]|nr:hypothetical protein [Chloroflexota bacterium]
MNPIRAFQFSAAILFAGLCFLLTAPQAHACSCGDFPTPAQAMAHAVKMFSGKVVAVHGGSGTEREPTLISGYVLVEFEVYTVWKGPAFATMFIETAWWSGSCGVEFYVGQEWLVISYDGDTTHPCSGTRHLELAQADVEALGAGQVPASGTTEPRRQSRDRIERFGAEAAAADAAVPAASSLWDWIPPWLSFALLIAVVVAVLGWVLRGTYRSSEG